MRAFTRKKEQSPSRSLLHRNASVLTQGSVLSQRDPSKLRQFNQQTDEHPQYQDKLLPVMPFKYSDESLIITPTIKNHERPVPRCMQYNDSNDPQPRIAYPELQYLGLEHIQDINTSTKPNYARSNATNTNKLNIKQRSGNINVRLLRLFSTDNLTKQPSDDTIGSLLSENVKVDSNDMMMDVTDAEQKQKQLEFTALQLEDEDAIDIDDDIEEAPDFKQLFPDDDEREIEIDKYLRKSPEIDDKQAVPPPDAIILPVYGEIKEYAKMLHMDRNVIAATLRHLGIYTHNIITQEAGQQLIEHLRPNTEVILEQLVDELVPRLPYCKSDNNLNLTKRKPVLCILGHVDHGKTTLLDYLRHSHVAQHEAGGITQSIGAFTVNMKQMIDDAHYDEITVFDTPGHAAFSGMRQRGAHVVDLAILVIDACDGIKPQTKESLAIIRREKLPFIVALNKIDRQEAEPDKIRDELQQLGVYNNEVEIVDISAKTGEGMMNLLETVDLICALEDPLGNEDMNCNAELVVIEGKKSAAEGTVIHALVQDGVLKNGDTLLKLHGFDRDSHAKISRLQNENGTNIDYAVGSTPVSFLGFSKVLPEVGTRLIAANDDKHAFDLIQMRETHEYYRNKLKIHARVSSSHPKLHDPTASKLAQSQSALEDLEEDELNIESKWSSTPHTDNPRQLNIWIRADTWGSIEAIENYLYQIKVPNDEYYFQIISKDVGPLYENIMKECDARNCYILNFNVPIKKSSYKTKYVTVFDSNVIFDLFNKFIETLEDKLAPVEKHVLCGRAWVKEVFQVKDREKMSYVAGCIVETGKIKYDGHFRVKRNGNIIFEQWGVSELKHFAVNVDEIECGDECGMKLEFEDWQPEDLVECLDIISEKNKIEPPIFDLDPVLQHSLYSGAASNTVIHEGATLFSYSEEESHTNAGVEDENEFIGRHKNTSDAPRVKATKNKRGKYVFESAE